MTNVIREYWWTVFCLYVFLMVAEFVFNALVEYYQWGIGGFGRSYWVYWLPLALLEASITYFILVMAVSIVDLLCQKPRKKTSLFFTK